MNRCSTIDLLPWQIMVSITADNGRSVRLTRLILINIMILSRNYASGIVMGSRRLYSLVLMFINVFARWTCLFGFVSTCTFEPRKTSMNIKTIFLFRTFFSWFDREALHHLCKPRAPVLSSVQKVDAILIIFIRPIDRILFRSDWLIVGAQLWTKRIWVQYSQRRKNKKR